MSGSNKGGAGASLADPNERRAGSIWFRFGKDLASPPRTVINSFQPTMAVEERPDDGMDLDQYPGFKLSVSELCHALNIKLAQTRGSRYVYATARPSLLND